MKATDTVSTFRYGPLWIVAVAALLLGALAAGVLFVTSSNRATQAPVVAAKESAAPSESPGEEPAAAPVANVSPFTCTASTLVAQNAPA
ncbi:MAG TPA: hypothetical protein VGK28_00855, partial [Candidatus Dormibacteraeota bacterium]